ncbi:hypothetical protein A3715_14270 [Oleiphilus sp. HI0009]|nr:MULTISPECIES: adenosylcobinamide-GDP ribazoletransferase [unclassified Oleiphilus]KZX75555.1 hypothetical protein A3715_14270 [Oleiphilus sp. HI0009]KZY68856.1 hypothetical protein A3739_10260 [Oleiphilus sp. HI0067]KZY69440.1 hypothetical protein A3738_04380 [Oleiphilus sp. HI0066]KZZ59170.1 hypothetical protein A3762_05835 [Oleiphilus sp. HI0125]
MIKRQLQLIHYALMFYTRIPLPSLSNVDQSTQDHASRYFPLVGWLVGSTTALAFILLSHIFSQELSILLVILLGIYMTGAFHEDGLADTCDGLGGGWSQEHILNIMKDSRLGTYGAVGLFFALALKFIALMQLPADYVPVVILVAHVFSRWYSVLVMRMMQYVRLDETSKAKPITKRFGNKDFSIATVLSFPALILLPPNTIIAVVLMGLPVYYLAIKLKRWLGGYTGDALGAIQQISEIGFLLAVLALLRLA